MLNIKKIKISTNYIYYIVNILCILSLLLITLSIERSSNYAVRPFIENEQCDIVQNVTIHREILYGSMMNDCFIGGIGNDIFYGNDGNDIFHGIFGNDELVGNSGNDVLNGYFGEDRLIGNSGNNVLDGGEHIDLIYGGKGDDKLIGGKGNDHLIGGPGADIYICGPGFDIIVGFNNLEKDIKTSDCEVVKEGINYNDIDFTFISKHYKFYN